MSLGCVLAALIRVENLWLRIVFERFFKKEGFLVPSLTCIIFFRLSLNIRRFTSSPAEGA